jgi:hypothetical protein
MRDRFLLPLMVLTGAGMIALSLVWPQGQGTPSPAPFGHPMAPPPPPAAALPPASFNPLQAAPAPEKPPETPAAKPAEGRPRATLKAPDSGLRPAQ